VRGAWLLGASLAVSVTLVLTACGGAARPRPDLVFVSTRDGDYAIYEMNADGGRQRRLTQGEHGDPSSPQGLFFEVEPAWSPDGRRIAFASKRDGTLDVFVMNADGTDARRLTSTSADDSHPTWSPDGRQLAFARGDQGDIWVMGADGSDAHPITHSGAAEIEPAWSPDGRWIAYVLKPQGATTQELWLVRPDGSGARQLTSLGVASDTPAWAPDSKRIAFSSRPGQAQSEIYEIGLTRKLPERLTTSTDDAFEPAWSPDGKSIAFSRGGSIVTIDRDGVANELTDPANNDSSPAWNPKPPKEEG
jgi:TolB protein